MTETFIDSKKEVDNHLKKTCEDFIHNISEDLIGPLKIFLSKVIFNIYVQENDLIILLQIFDPNLTQ